MALDLYGVFLDVEEAFDIRIPEADMQLVESIGDLFDVTLKNLRQQHPEYFTGNNHFEQTAWERLKDLLMYQLELRPEQIVRSARFYVELGFK